MNFIRQHELGELIESAEANILNALYEHLPAEKLMIHHFILDDFKANPNALIKQLSLIGDFSFSAESEETQLNSMLDMNYIHTQLDIIEKAKQQILEAYLPLVVKIAAQYKDQNIVHFLDLIQYGNIGLMKAIDHYNHASASRFLPYTIKCIHRSIAYSITRTLLRQE